MKFSFTFGRLPKAFCLTLVFFLSLFKSFSQESKSKYNLLWQISGKGLSKPSYLFGSMHVQDRRAFNFSDSVIKAIQGTSGFVLEVHPDSLTRSIFNSNVQEKDKGRITKLITAEQKAELIRRFKTKNGYLPDSALLDNPVLVAALMKPDFSKKDDMQSFMDIYLYGMAKMMKKNIFGLEKPEDQVKLLYGDDQKIAALFDLDEETEAQNFEKMINIYAKGNLEEITAILKEGNEDQLDLVGRNKVMADGIIKLMASNDLFVAVGAAHLSGEEGLINLLKNQGYTLRAVKAGFTGVARSFKMDYAKIDWVKYKDATENFEIEFPAQPFVSKEIVGKSLSCSDLITNTLYAVNASYIGPLEKMSPKQYLDTVLNEYISEDVKLLKKKSDNRFGGAGLDVEMETAGKFARFILVYKNNTLYIVNAESGRNNLHETYVERFISSFKIGDAVSVKDGGWADYKHNVGGFSLKVPMQPEEMIKEVPNPSLPSSPYVMNMYTMLDKVNNVSYLFKYNDFPEGMYLADKATAFEGTIKQMERSAKIVNGPTTIYKNGLEGREVGLSLRGSAMKVQVFLRGNRTYLLMRQEGGEADTLNNNNFFDSFKFEKYAEGEVVPFAVEDIKVVAPGKTIEVALNKEVNHSSILSNSRSYYAKNKNSGGVYTFETGNLSKYAKISDIDSFYVMMINGIKKQKDTIKKTEDVVIGNSKAKIFTYTDSATATERKVKIWINQNRFYYQSVMCTQEEMEGRQVKAFFEQFTLTDPPKPFDLKASKAKLLFEDLKSRDSLVFKPAYGALSYYEFDKTEVPLISAALKFKYADDTAANGVRLRLIRKLSALYDKKSVPLLKELFADIKNTDEIRAKALTEVVKLDSTQYGWYLKSLSENKALNVESYWNLFKPLSDSLPFVAKNFGQVMALKNKIQYRGSVLDLITDMINEDNRSTYLTLVKNNRAMVTSNAMADLNAYVKDRENKYSYLMFPYLSILPEIGMYNLTDIFTKKIMTDTGTYIATQAMCARIKASLPLDQKMLAQQLDSLTTRYDILLAFDAAKKMEQVPAKYQQHEEIAKMKLYNYIGEEQDYPETITLLDKIKEEEKTYYVFEFTLTIDDEKKTFLGACGPFDNKSNELTIKDYFCYSDFEVKKEDWQEQIKNLIKVLQEE